MESVKPDFTLGDYRPQVDEHTEQSIFFSTVLLRYGADPGFVRPLFFAVPNAGKRGRKARRDALQEGLTAGVADLLYLQPRGDYAFCAIEMKRAHGGKVRPGQVEWLAAAAAVGGCVDVCHGAEEAMTFFDAYMAMPPKFDPEGGEVKVSA